jgi:hypothetical protein
MRKQEGEAADIPIYVQDQQEKLIHILIFRLNMDAIYGRKRDWHKRERDYRFFRDDRVNAFSDSSDNT